MRKATRFLMVALSAMAMSASSQGSQSSAHLRVSAHVPPNCRIAVSDLSFGSYDPLQQHAIQDLQAAAEVQVHCTRSSRASLVLDGGRHRDGSERTMRNGVEVVRYDIYRDAQRTNPFPADDSALVIVSQTSRSPYQLTLYGRIPPGQVVSSGLYTDVVTASVDF